MTALQSAMKSAARPAIQTGTETRRSVSTAQLIAVAGFMAFGGLAAVLLWIYGTFSNPQLRLCAQTIAGDRALYVCQPATDQPIALVLVTVTSLIPALTVVAILAARAATRTQD